MLYLLTVYFTMLSVSSLHTIKRQDGQRMMNCREFYGSVHGLYKHRAEKNHENKYGKCSSYEQKYVSLRALLHNNSMM